MQLDELARTAQAVSNDVAPAWSELIGIGAEISDGAQRAGIDPMEDGDAAVRGPNDTRGPNDDTDAAQTGTGDGGSMAEALMDDGRTARPNQHPAGGIAPDYIEGGFVPGGPAGAAHDAEPAATLDMQQRQLAVLQSIERNTSRQAVAVAE